MVEVKIVLLFCTSVDLANKLEFCLTTPENLLSAGHEDASSGHLPLSGLAERLG